jgi:hypothetical protein
LVARRYYINIIHPYWVFFENLVCYGAAAGRLSWMTTLPWTQWSADRPEWQDPNNVIIVWLWGSPGILDVVAQERKATLVIWYIESVGPPEGLCSDQKATLTRFLDYFKVPDLVVVGFPSSEEFLRPYCRKVIHAPTGYDPGIMGKPDWSQPKEFDFGFCGLQTGRREWILPALKRRFGPRFVHILGKFGMDRKRIYDRCRAVLYIAHSTEPCFAPLRIWQSIASAAAIVTEKRDVWPAVAGKHYIELPEAQEACVDEFVDQVEQTLQFPLEAIARRAHEDLSQYTVDRAMEYIVAAVEGT